MAQPFNTQIQLFKSALRLTEAFRAADRDQDGWIDAQELEGIRGIHPARLNRIKTIMRRYGKLRLLWFLYLSCPKLEAGDEFGAALKKCLLSTGKDSWRGEDLCDTLVNNGITLSIQDSEDLVSSIDNYGIRTISHDDLKIIVRTLVQ